tara:strand:- start:90 stop:437 length:348 start_codon:yes stop_codon:yes gene_type:complete
MSSKSTPSSKRTAKPSTSLGRARFGSRTPLDVLARWTWVEYIPDALVILLGGLTILGAIMGWIQPLWFASILVVVANFSIGLAFFDWMKRVLRHQERTDRTLRDQAIERMLNEKN